MAAGTGSGRGSERLPAAEADSGRCPGPGQPAGPAGGRPEAAPGGAAAGTRDLEGRTPWLPAPSHPRVWQELSNKDQEKVAEVSRVRVELQEQNGRLQAELAAQEALREKVAALERRLKGELSLVGPVLPG